MPADGKLVEKVESINKREQPWTACGQVPTAPASHRGPYQNHRRQQRRLSRRAVPGSVRQSLHPRLMSLTWA